MLKPKQKPPTLQQIAESTIMSNYMDSFNYSKLSTLDISLNAAAKLPHNRK